MSSEIQSIVFLIRPIGKRWNATKARLWLKAHNLKAIKKVDIVKVKGKPSQLRYRIRDPAKYKKFVTHPTETDNINIILGIK